MNVVETRLQQLKLWGKGKQNFVPPPLFPFWRVCVRVGWGQMVRQEHCWPQGSFSGGVCIYIYGIYVCILYKARIICMCLVLIVWGRGVREHEQRGEVMCECKQVGTRLGVLRMGREGSLEIRDEVGWCLR